MARAIIGGVVKRCGEAVRLAAIVPAALALLGCAGDRQELLLASTTSTEDSGLFEVLLPAYMERRPEVVVKVTAVGTGQALELGRRRDADVLLVHAPEAEAEFVAAGRGSGRCQVMYNDFVVAGPPSDPAAVRGVKDAAEAFRRIASSGAEFISRGDDSGTHRKEQALWRAAGVQPSGGWYMQIGQGMAESLRMAIEQRAYVLTDRATYLDQTAARELPILLEGDARLFNPYGVIPVVGARHPRTARDFALWITSAEAQALIGEYGADRFGQPLFVPNADECELPEAPGG